MNDHIIDPDRKNRRDRGGRWRPPAVRMCLRRRSGAPQPEDLPHDGIYTGPIPAERGKAQVTMGRGLGESSPLSGAGSGRGLTESSVPSGTGSGRGSTTADNSHWPDACCLCWCCCCNCSRTEEARRRRRRRRSQDTKTDVVSKCEPCAPPSAAEVLLWSGSFEDLLRNPAGRNVFRHFLRSEYSEENLMFWLACEDLKQEVDKSRVSLKARRIYEDYVSVLSPREVSLDARVREVINKQMKDPTGLLFEEAQLQIFTLMHRDSYPRFISSNIYRNLLHQQAKS